ncbi:MAG: hypothetical protein RR571_06480 [Anaerorhabdus sp.]
MMKNRRSKLIAFYIVVLVVCSALLVIFYPSAYDLVRYNYDLTWLQILGFFVLPIMFFSFAALFTLVTGLKFTKLSHQTNRIILLISFGIMGVYFAIAIAWILGVSWIGSLMLKIVSIVSDFKYLFLVLGIMINASIDLKDLNSELNNSDEQSADSIKMMIKPIEESESSNLSDK